MSLLANNIYLEVFIVAVLVLMLVGNICFLFFRKDNSQINILSETMIKAQAELAGRLSQMGEINRAEQSRLTDSMNEQKMAVLKILDEKLLAVTKSVGQGLEQSTTKTTETLQDLRERLAKIDVAQQKISSHSEHVHLLQAV